MKRFVPRLRDPSIKRIAFTCFRLVKIHDREPNEPPYAPIELMSSTNTMSVFTMLPCDAM